MRLVWLVAALVASAASAPAIGLHPNGDHSGLVPREGKDLERAISIPVAGIIIGLVSLFGSTAGTAVAVDASVTAARRAAEADARRITQGVQRKREAALKVDLAMAEAKNYMQALDAGRDALQKASISQASTKKLADAERATERVRIKGRHKSIETFTKARRRIQNAIDAGAGWADGVSAGKAASEGREYAISIELAKVRAEGMVARCDHDLRNRV